MRELRADYINWYTAVRDILRNIWVVILAALVGFLGVRAYYNFTYEPYYSCSTTIAVSATESGIYTFSNLNKTIEAASTFQEMFQSSYFREKLSDLTGTEVTGNIKAQQIEETNLIVISYSCSSPVEAYRILVAIVENYNEITDHSFKNMIINTISPPAVPVAPANTISYHNYDVIAFALCAAAVLLIIFAYSYFRDTVKNISDVEEMLDTKLFGVVYHEEKNKTIKSKLRFTHSKAPLMITNILINYRFTETFRVMALKLEYLMKTKDIKTLMLVSCGENEGKSTAAVNIALALSSIGKKTLLVDGDFRKPAVYKFFGGASGNDEKYYGLGEVVSENISINKAVRRDKKSGLYLLSGDQQYRNSGEIVTTARFEQFIASIKNQFDIIVFDTAPAALVSDSEIMASSIDAALIVVRQDVAPVPEINDMIDDLNQGGTEVLGCVFNDVHAFPFAENEKSVSYGQSSVIQGERQSEEGDGI